MVDQDVSRRIKAALDEQGLSPEVLDALASQLVWRIGRTSDDAPVTIRVGFATSAHLFAELPRLRSASDAELEEAVQSGELRVEWVGLKPRSGHGGGDIE